MQPVDRCGNKLEEGHVVEATLHSDADSSQTISTIGTIVKVQPGGVRVIGGQLQGKKEEMVTPGEIVVVVQYRYLFNPDQAVVRELLRVVVPPQPEHENLLKQ